MSQPGAPSAAPQPVASEAEQYLAAVTALLPGPSRACGGIIDELRSGLLDAADARLAAGLQPDAAIRAAIGEFGDPGQVADAIRPEVAATQARFVAAAVLVTGPLVGALWFTTAAASHLAPHSQWAGLSLVAAAVAVTAWGALSAIAVTGRLTRWLAVRPRRAPTAAAIAGLGAVCADALGLALLAVQLSAAPGKLALPLAAAAAAASAARLLLASRAARHCLALRASLT